MSDTAAAAAAETGPVGRVLSSEASKPMDFWVAVSPGCVLQLDDVISTRRAMPSGEDVSLYGVVNDIEAKTKAPLPQRHVPHQRRADPVTGF